MVSQFKFIAKSFFTDLCAVTFWLIFLCPLSSFAAENQERPNVLFILVDDLGWSDLTFMGSRGYETPNVDRLASEGMVFTHFYSGGPVCSPTRASIMTGKSTARTGITTYLITPEQDDDFVTHQLELAEYTLAESLRDQGYTTGYFGKWHLGYEQKHWASNQGFDIAKGGVSSINAWKILFPEQKPPLDYLTQINYFSPYHATHIKDGPKGEYMTDRLTDEVIDFIEGKSGKAESFFAFLSFHTVHTPLEAKAETISKYRKKFDDEGILGNEEKANGSRLYQNIPEYAAMVAHMDENVGRLLKKLDELNLRENTIVIFTSDNGGKMTVTSNAPLRGGKHNLYEGGIRIPLIVRWPGKIKNQTINETPLITDDLYPTLLDLLDLSLIPEQHQDGHSFKDILLGKSNSINRGPLYWHYPHGVSQAAIRSGEYKLVYAYKTGKASLFNLKEDISEKKDLSTIRKGKTRKMKALLSQWLDESKAKFPDEGIIKP
jgi:arylsulfatase A-like enzyme